ncbi:putative ribonuclease H-like domain-containing protein [Tanacetum coccineum]
MLWLATLASKEEQITSIIRTLLVFAYFLSQIEPKKVIQALTDPSWIEAMQEEHLQFKLQKGLESGGSIKKARELLELRIEAIRLFLAYASFMGFIVYQMDVKSAFLYGTIKEEVYVCQPPAWYETLSTYLIENGFRRGTIDKTVFIKKDKDDILLVQVYVDDIIFGSTKKSLCDEFKQMMHKKFQMSSIGELTFFLGLQVQQKKDGIFISHDKYMVDILKTSRPDITFAVCACARFQVTPKTSHLHAVKRIFRYLKGQPKLGLWYPRDSPFDLEAFSKSDYAGASLDRKSTTGGCQFLGKRLISWQCKKQTIVANSTTEAEYVAAANYCGQNPMFHSKTEHIEIRHHFIRDSYEKKFIQVIKIHIDHNVADLLTKAFDVSRFKFLIASIGLLRV